MLISIARNVATMTCDTNTRNISFIAGFDNIANVTVKYTQGKCNKLDRLVA